ncbi:MAG: ABC transporter permease [Trueperaceae bacterium]
MLGSLTAAIGLFFLPLIELKPNRIASGIPFQLLELQGDMRYLVLFLLSLAPIAVALRSPDRSRGWLLAGLGNALLVLTLYLPASAGQRLIDDAGTLLVESLRVSNPRILPSAALALGLAGGYVVLFAGLRDLERAGVGRAPRLSAAWGGAVLLAVMLVAGTFDVYSVVVEFHARGAQLGQRFIEHVMFVGVSLTVGLVLGVGLGLWAHRDQGVSPAVLYTVGIIQTVPSLALFGVLLVPLARLGDQRLTAVALVFAVTLAVAAGLFFLFRRLAGRFTAGARQVLLMMVATVSAVPLALLVVVTASFLFRVAMVAFTSDAGPFPRLRVALLATLLVAMAALLVGRRLRPGWTLRVVRYASYAAGTAFTAALAYALVRASQLFLVRVTDVASVTLRELGVSGIGTAPAVIALTLYSLLPLVRNTFAGLNNVDPAIIDAGRGMGMNAGQRFVQLELPIALPVIMAGVRNAAVALVGIGAIATVIGAGGLGDFILGGIVNTSIDQILLGAVPAVLLATVFDTVLQGLERLLVSPGIRQLEGAS